MSVPTRLIALSGSTRRESYNRRLVRIAGEGASRAGGEIHLVDLNDFELPLYHADHEAEHGMPKGAAAFKELCVAADGYLIAAPEYNGSLPAALKNAIDWLSRPGPGETELSHTAFRGKVAGIMSASPGAWGGVRGLAHLRQILAGLNVLVTAEQIALPAAQIAFDEHGRLKNATFQTLTESIGARTVHLARVLKNP
jgi:NAD(P)H-dependent FMN reductase